MQKLIYRFFTATIIITIIALMYYFRLHSYFSIDNLHEYEYELKNFITHYYIFSVFLYIVLYILTTSFSLPVATTFTLAAGFLFGSLLGAFYSLIGATGGALGAFLFVRYLIGDWAREKYKERLDTFYYHLQRYGLYYLLMVRIVPIFPFFIVNVVAALMPISVGIFALTTFVGMIPAAFVYATIGSQLNQVFKGKSIFSVQTIVAVTILIVLTIFMYSVGRKIFNARNER